jgi:hypothetical protein
MTEEEWRQCADPERMLDFLDGKVNDRRLRLFACACCRSIWDLIDTDLHRRAVELAERFADGPGSLVEWERGQGGGKALLARNLLKGPQGEGAKEWKAMLEALEAEWKALPEDAYFFQYDNITPEETAAWTLYLRSDLPWVVANFSARLRAAPFPYWKQLRELDVQGPAEAEWHLRHQGARAVQAGLLRDIFGPLPFRSLHLEHRWRTPLVVSLARAAYEERVAPDPSRPGWLVLDPVRLLVLADALEEAGCGDPEILEHLRGPGPHVRGCFLLDLLLARS